MKRHLNKRTIAVVMAAALLAACTDSTGTGGTTLNTTEKLALTAAITSSGALAGAGTEASYAPLAILLVPSVGSLGTSASARAVANGINFAVRGARAATYEGAIGVQVIYTAQGVSGTWTGVIGWSGLNTAQSSVSEFVAAGAQTLSTTPVGSSSTTPIGGTAAGATGWASYWAAATSSRYDGTSGSFVLTSTSFTGSATDCSSVSQTSACSYTAGTISGSFGFGSSRASGTGALTYDQATVNFSGLPALRITVTR